MYGQANYGSQKPLPPPPPPPAYPQRAVAPPPPPPPTSYFQQGPPIPSHSMNQQATVPPPLGPPLFQGPSAQVLPGGITNVRQTYFHAFQPVHGSAQVPQFNPNTTQQNVPLSHSGIQNMHHILPPPPSPLPPPPPLRTPNPDLLRPSMVVPVHPPFQGQFYGAQVHPPMQQGGFQVLPSIPHHPSTSNQGESHLPTLPPPPPSSPPPVPPSPPPPTSPSFSSISNTNSSNLLCQSDFDPSSVIHSTQELKARESSERGMDPCHVGNNAPKHGELGKCETQIDVMVGSKVDDDRLPNNDDYMQDLSPSPPNSILSAGSISPADSDMEMEDDITPANIGEGASHSFDIQTYECKSRDKEHGITQQFRGPEDSQRCSPTKDKVVEDGATIVLLDEKSPTNAARQVSSPMVNTSGISKQPQGSNFEISVTRLANDESLAGVSAASEAISSSQSTSLMTGGSPFKLIQDYVSDESSENDDESQSHLKDANISVASSAPASAKTSNGDTDNLTAYVGFRSSCQVRRGFGAPGEVSVSDTGAKFLSELQKQVNDSSVANVRIGMEDEQNDKNQRNQVGSSTGSYKSLDATIGGSVDVLYESDKLQRENDEDKLKHGSSPAKVDEFGRLVREGGSESDSDDSHYARRRKNRRIRNSSHSHSPVDRRRGRRSPRRRRERRSRSRSWSPRNQRGRSRSPVSRRTSQFNNENMRRERGLMQRCFDFQRGRCYRGASCRYMHHEPKNDGSRLHRSKQHHDIHPASKNIKVREETEDMSREVSDLVHIEVKNQESHNMSSKGDILDWKTYSANADPDSDITKCRSSRDRADSVEEDEKICSKPPPAAAHIHSNENGQEAEKSCQQPSVIAISLHCTSNADTEKFSGDISTSILASSKNSLVQQSNISVAELQTTDSSSRQMDDSFVSNLLPDQVIAVTTIKSLEREPFPDKTSSIKPQLDTSSAPALVHALGDSHPLHELPPPPPLLISHVASSVVPLPVPSNFVPQNVSFPSHSSLHGNFHPHQNHVSIQPSHYPGASFLPQRLTYNSTLAPVTTIYSTPMQFQESPPMQFQESHLSQGSGLGSQSVVKSQPMELHAHSQVGESPVQEPWRAPNPMHMDGLRSVAPTANNQPSQPFGVPSFQKEENFSRTSVELNSSNFFPHGNLSAHSIPLTNELPSNRIQISGENFPPGEFRSSISQFHPYPRFQQPMYASHQPSYDSFLRGPGQVGSISRHFPDPLSRNESSPLPDFRGLGIPSYHNPYASTFEKPLSSNFRSNVLKLGNDVPTVDVGDSTFSLSSVRVEGQGADCVGSRHTNASPNSTRPLHSSGGDQYDPLFDSIEPSSPIIKKSKLGQKLEKIRESHITTKLSGPHKPLDVEENNKHKEVAAVASTTSLSLENDEFGETADAEAGAVDNDPVDDALLTGEIDIDQLESPGKSKTSKGSRSLRLFKIAIADFVKEVLKPSWRQGNMSKEAFKTIVKKTVDKVAGAMKSHQVPKSQAKINRYMDSSQRKLTKLVMGYVDKYVKT